MLPLLTVSKNFDSITPSVVLEGKKGLLWGKEGVFKKGLLFICLFVCLLVFVHSEGRRREEGGRGEEEWREEGSEK